MTADGQWDDLTDSAHRRACVDACRAGNVDAAWAICLYCQRQLGSVVVVGLRTSGTYGRDVANDIVQESMNAAVAGRLGGYRGDADVCTYIAGIGKRKVLEYRRRQRKELDVVPLRDSDAADRGDGSPSDSIPQLIANRDLLAKIFAGLSAEDHLIAERKWVSGLTDWEIAQELQLAEGTISSRVSRMRQAVKAKFDQ